MDWLADGWCVAGEEEDKVQNDFQVPAQSWQVDSDISYTDGTQSQRAGSMVVVGLGR